MSVPPKRLDEMARELFGFDVDLRLRDVWAIAGELTDDEWNRSRAGMAMRVAYVFGYRDAMREAGQLEGELTREYQRRREGGEG